MKLTTLDIHTVAVPPPHLGGLYWTLVVLRTADGIEGVGEVYGASVGPAAMTAVIADVFARHLEGQDPHHVERFVRRAYSSGFSQRPDPTVMGAASGLEMACWDIVGKAAGKPVYELMGGLVNERLRTYTYLYPRNAAGALDFDDPDLAAAEAARLVAQGFTAVKFDPAGPYTAFSGHQLSLPVLARCEAFCRTIREAVGDRADLLFGTHGQMVPSSAIRLAARLERYDPLWFEEPVPPDNEEAMAAVARATTIPIAAGERLTTMGEFLRVLRAGAASILQPNLGRCGGLLEGKKIAAVAQGFGAQLAPHLYNGPVGAAASIQLAACTPNVLIQESIGDMSGFHAELLDKPLRWEDGFLIPSPEPGLGITLDMAAVRRHSPYTGERLHLQMAPDPVDIRSTAPARG